MIEITVTEKQIRTYHFDDDFFQGSQLNPDDIRSEFLGNPEADYEKHLVNTDVVHYDADVNIPVNKTVSVCLEDIVDLDHNGFLALLETKVGLGPLCGEQYKIVGIDPEDKSCILLQVTAELASQ